jgi:hypothetical protein
LAKSQITDYFLFSALKRGAIIFANRLTVGAIINSSAIYGGEKQINTIRL